MNNNCPVDLTPYASPDITKTPEIINLNYTSQDFWSLKTKLIDFLLERFGPEGTELPNTFNDLIESSIAIMLIENWAFLGDLLSFKMDQIVNEIFIDTVSEIENAFRLAKLVGFYPQPPIAARSMWSGTMNTPLETDVVIPAPIKLSLTSNDKSIIVELFQADSNKKPLYDSDIVIIAGQTINTSIVGLEGKTIVKFYAGTGEIAQSIQLNGPTIYDSIQVMVDGVIWEEVLYFSGSKPLREYRVEFDSSYNGFVIFGNNRAGIIPSKGSQIKIRYRQGGGTAGNIITNAITTQKMAAVTGLDYTVPVVMTNYTRGEFGYAGDTIDDVRQKLPMWLSTQNRAVSGSDYKILCDQFATPYNGSIGKSTSELRHHGCAGNVIDIYILAKDDEDDLMTASNELKVELYEYLEDKKMMTDHICLRDGQIVDVDVSIEVILNRFYRKFEEEIKNRVLNNTNAFFSLNNWNYGKALKDTDLIKELSSIKQISSFEIDFTTADEDNSGQIITTNFYEIIRPDDITISFSYQEG